MAIVLSPQTERMVEAQMRSSGIASADELITLVLERMNGTEGEPYEELDEETRQAIEVAEKQYRLGDEMDLDEAVAQIRKKHSL